MAKKLNISEDHLLLLINAEYKAVFIGQDYQLGLNWYDYKSSTFDQNMIKLINNEQLLSDEAVEKLDALIKSNQHVFNVIDKLDFRD